MKKIDLIEVLSKKTKVTQVEAKLSIEIILNEMSLAIILGKGIEIRGFGGFQKRYRKGRMGINPKTGEKTNVAEKFVPFFKPGKVLKESVNNS